MCDPSNYEPWWQESIPSYCVAYDSGDENGNQVTFAPVDDEQLSLVYCPSKDAWEKRCENPRIARPKLGRPMCAELNGIRYLSYCNWLEFKSNTTTLYAYDISSGKQLLGDGK